MSVFRLNRFRVATRIHAGFGFLILLGLAIAVSGLWQLSAVEADAVRLAVINRAAGQASEEMLKVSVIAEGAEATSQQVLAGADELGRTADTLRDEVGQFLAAMAEGREAA